MNQTTQSPHDRHRHYRYYDYLMAGFVTILICSNFIGPAKVSEIDFSWLPLIGGVLVFGVGNIFFPISYIFGDVLTEVYGFARARKVIWAGFFAIIFASIMSTVIIHLPLSGSEPFNVELQSAIELVFGNSWRIVFASILAFWVGDFVNAYVMAKMKLLTQGKHLWTRTIGSTICGQAIDSLIFYPIAFYGIWENTTLLYVILFNGAFKIAVEIIMTPVTYRVVGWLKKKEGEDFYDTDTNFTPFSMRD
ncbi:MAG: queuosine precursor transporter [Pseudomonadales bacterium]|nr:queuosine precursor transporter [Pseudomonadales bacterium]